MSNDEFLTIEEVCEKLNRSERQVYQLKENNQLLPSAKNQDGMYLWWSKDVEEFLTFLKTLREGKVDYIFFLNDYCGTIETDPVTGEKIDNRVAGWFYLTPTDYFNQSDSIEIFITKDFLKFTNFKKITVPRVLDFLQRVELTNELNKLLGFKQHD